MSPRKAETTCPRCRTKHRVGDRCPTCARRYRQTAGRRRRDDIDAWYSTSAWQAISRAFLRDHPWCVWPGCTRPSQVADHWPQSRRELLASGAPDPDAPHRLRPLCKSHHARETRRNQPTGSVPRPTTRPPKPPPPDITF